MNIPTCVSSFFLGILARKLLWNHQIEPKKWPYWIAVTVQSVDKTLQKIRGVKPEKQKSKKKPCLPAAMLSPPKSLFPRVFPAFSGWIHQRHSSRRFDTINYLWKYRCLQVTHEKSPPDLAWQKNIRLLLTRLSIQMLTIAMLDHLSLGNEFRPNHSGPQIRV